MSDQKQLEVLEVPVEEISPEKRTAEETRVFRIKSRERLIELTGESEWTLTQQLFQEVQSDYLVKDTKKKPTGPELLKRVTELVEERYKDEDELRTVILDSIPTVNGIYKWLKMNGWEEAVWSKLRTSNLFNKESRTEVIQALKKRAIEGSDSAAKIWLTLSGDYSDKLDVNSDKRVEVYREINQILHRAKGTQ